MAAAAAAAASLKPPSLPAYQVQQIHKARKEYVDSVHSAADVALGIAAHEHHVIHAQLSAYK